MCELCFCESEERGCSEVTSWFGLLLGSCTKVALLFDSTMESDWLEGGMKLWSSFTTSAGRRVKLAGVAMVASSEL